MTKSTYPLFESVLVLSRRVRNAKYHQRRFLRSYHEFFGRAPDYDLFAGIALPQEIGKGAYKLKIEYGTEGKLFTMAPYLRQLPKTLKVVYDNGIRYSVKTTDRSALETLFEQRGTADDILIVKNGTY